MTRNRLANIGQTNPFRTLAGGRTGISEPLKEAARVLLFRSGHAHDGTALDALSALGAETYEAGNATEAVQILSRKRVELVLLNLRPAYTSQLNFCRLIKRDPHTRVVPVFVIGDALHQNQEVESFAAGADDFIARPLRRSTFQARVGASLRRQSVINLLDDAESVLLSLAESVEGRDPGVRQHCYRLALMAASMGP